MNKLLAAIDFLAQRRKAIVSFLSGCIGIYILYVALAADGTLSPDDLNTLLWAALAATGGTAAVHQASNKGTGL